MSKSNNGHPELIVYDLDACLRDKEMSRIDHVPGKTVREFLNGRGD